MERDPELVILETYFSFCDLVKDRNKSIDDKYQQIFQGLKEIYKSDDIQENIKKFSEDLRKMNDNPFPTEEGSFLEEGSGDERADLSECKNWAQIKFHNNSCFLDSINFVLFTVWSDYFELIRNRKLNLVKSRKLILSDDDPKLTDREMIKKDLEIRKKILSSYGKVYQDFQSTKLKKDFSCSIELRKALRDCGEKTRFLTGGEIQDAPEYLNFLLQLFECYDLKETSSDGRTELIRPYYGIQIEDIGNELFEEFITNTNSSIDRNLDLQVPYFVIHLIRGSNVSGYNRFNSKSINAEQEYINEGITYQGEASLLMLHAIVCYKDRHYTAYIRCKNHWFFYDDLEDELEYICYTFEELVKSEHQPYILKQGVLWFYKVFQ